jgi:hypothetical protein
VCYAIPVTGVKPDMSGSGNLMPQLFRVAVASATDSGEVIELENGSDEP